MHVLRREDLKRGFVEEYRTEKIVMLKKELR